MSRPSNRRPNENDPRRGRKLRVERLEERTMLAGDFELVKDIAPGAASSFPLEFVEVGGIKFFTAQDEVHGVELWKTDGTTAGTALVKDIFPGIDSSGPGNLINVGGVLYFTANDGVHGTELWKTDGTESQTVLVKDINPGLPSSMSLFSPERGMANVNGVLYFSAGDAARGIELWRSNGTAAGTYRVIDIRNGSLSSYPKELTNVNGTLFFTADDGATGHELWAYKIGGGNIALVKEIRAGVFDGAGGLTNVGGVLLFGGGDGNLWKSDGTTAGTVVVKDVSPSWGMNVGGTLFFFNYSSATGTELWKSDGTNLGTQLVKDINAGSGGSFTFLTFVNVGGVIYFSGNDGISGAELWKSDGTDAGTVRVKDIRPGNLGSSPRYLANLNGKLYFSAVGPTGQEELWISDGSEQGTAVAVPGSTLAAIGPLKPLFSIADRIVVATETAEYGKELWVADQPPLLLGDFNHDLVVDAADYVFWVAHFGESSGVGLQADDNGDQIVDSADYTLWRDNFGNFIDDHAGVSASATFIGQASVIDGLVSRADDRDWFQFIGAPGFEHQISLRLGTLSDSALRIYAADGVTILHADVNGGPARINFTPPTAGVYYAVVEGVNGALGSYSLVTARDDHAERFELATPLTLPGTTAGNILSSTDADWFQISAVAGFQHRLSLTPGTLGSGTLRVFGSDGVTLVASDLNGGPGYVEFTPTAPGSFYAMVDGFGGATGGYSLQVVLDDHAEVFGLATQVIVPGSTPSVGGTIGSATDVDWFKVLAQVGIEQRITVSLGTITGVTLRVYDTNGVTLMASDVNGGSATLEIIPQTTGDYYCEVVGFSGALGTYTLSVSRDDHSGLAAYATALTIPGSMSGSITSTTDVDWFRFNTVGGVEHSINVSTFRTVRVFAADGVTLLASRTDSSSAAVVFTPTTTGQYFVQVSAYSIFTGTYNLSITRDDIGESAGFARLVDVPSTTAGNITTTTDQDWFRFNVSAGTMQRLAVTRAGFSGGVSLLVYDQSGSVTVASDTDGGNALVNFIPTTTGPYFARVTGTASFTGTYSVTVSRDDAGDSASTAVGLLTPSTITGAIDLNADLDLFRFTAAAGRAHRLTLALGTLTSGTLRLISANGVTAIVSDLDGDAAQLVYTPSSVGTLYVEVAGFSGASGSYSLTIAVDDHGDSTSTATSILNPGASAGEIGSSTDIDYFAFPLTAGSPISVTVSPGTISGVSVVLRNSSGGTVATDTNGAFGHVLHSPTTTGVFYAEVTGFSGATGSYTISIDDHGDSSLAATPITLTGVTTGIIATSSDRDWFRFNTAVGVEHRLFAALGSLSGAVLQIYDANGTTLLASDVDGGLGSVSFTPPTTGPYFAEVTGFAGSTGSYSLSLTREDHGNNSTSATTIAIPSTTTGLVDSATDADWFRFNGLIGLEHRLVLTLGWLSGGRLRVYDADGATLLASDIDGGMADVNFTPSTIGPYFAEVTGFAGELGTYSLVLSRDDHGDSTSLATDLSVPSTTSGVISTTTDLDWFRFSALPNFEYRFTLTPGTLAGTKLRLVDSDGVTVLASDIDGGAAVVNFVPVTAGTYYVEVAGFNEGFGTYSLVAARDDHGDSPVLATALAVGVTATGLIGSATDIDWFVFDTLAGYEYQVALSLSSLTSGALRLFDINGTTLLASDINGGAAVVNFSASRTGPYYAEVAGFSSATGTYSLLVSRDDHGFVPTTATNNAANGTISSPADIDLFRVITEVGYEYNATLLRGTVGSTALRVLEPDGMTIIAADIDGANAVNFFAPPTTGPYFYQVTSPFDSMGTYSFAVQRDDHGYTATTASPVTTGLDILGNVINSADSDWFSFNTTVGLRYNLTVSLATLVGSILRVRDANGITVLVNDADGGTGSASFVPTTFGPYYAEVRGFDNFVGAYVLRITTSIPSGAVIAVATAAVSAIESPANEPNLANSHTESSLRSRRELLTRANSSTYEPPARICFVEPAEMAPTKTSLSIAAARDEVFALFGELEARGLSRRLRQLR